MLLLQAVGVGQAPAATEWQALDQQALELYVQGDLPKAIAAAEHALKAAPDHAVTLEAIGFMRLKRDLDAVGALYAFEAAIRAGGVRADLYGNLGIALQDMARIPEALDAYGRALTAAPQNPLYRWHRSLALLLACSCVACPAGESPSSTSGASKSTPEPTPTPTLEPRPEPALPTPQPLPAVELASARAAPRRRRSETDARRELGELAAQQAVDQRALSRADRSGDDDEVADAPLVCDRAGSAWSAGC